MSQNEDEWGAFGDFENANEDQEKEENKQEDDWADGFGDFEEEQSADKEEKPAVTIDKTKAMTPDVTQKDLSNQMKTQVQSFDYNE